MSNASRRVIVLHWWIVVAECTGRGVVGSRLRQRHVRPTTIECRPITRSPGQISNPRSGGRGVWREQRPRRAIALGSPRRSSETVCRRHHIAMNHQSIIGRGRHEQVQCGIDLFLVLCFELASKFLPSAYLVLVSSAVESIAKGKGRQVVLLRKVIACDANSLGNGTQGFVRKLALCLTDGVETVEDFLVAEPDGNAKEVVVVVDIARLVQ